MHWTTPWLGWLLAWIIAAGGGAGWLAQQRLQTLNEGFQTNARIAHRLLSQQLAQKEGIFVGITSGGTFAAALKVAEKAPAGSTILAMLPDTGERYLSTILFEGLVG